MLRLKPIRPADIPDLQEVQAPSFRPRLRSDVFTTGQVMRDWPFSRRRDMTWLLEETRGVGVAPRDVLGYVSLQTLPSGILEISQIGVHPDRQNLGYGALLVIGALRAGLEFAEPTLGVQLHVDVDNLSALHLYSRLGFERVERVPEWIPQDDGSRSPAFCMRYPSSNTSEATIQRVDKAWEAAVAYMRQKREDSVLVVGFPPSPQPWLTAEKATVQRQDGRRG